MCFLLADAIFTGPSEKSQIIQISLLTSLLGQEVSSIEVPKELFMYIDHESIDKSSIDLKSGVASFAIDDLMIVKEIKKNSIKEGSSLNFLYSKDEAAQVLNHLSSGLSKSLAVIGKGRRVPFVSWGAERVVDHLESYGVTKNILLPIDLQHAMFGLKLEAITKSDLLREFGLPSEIDTLGFCRAVSESLKKAA